MPRVGHENSAPSCCEGLVLMDEPAEDISSADLRRTVHRFSWYYALGCSKLDASMRPLRVVVPGVDAENPIKVSSTTHHDPVQAFPSYCPDEALGDRVGLRRADRGEDDPRPLGLEHLIERARVLGVAVSDQEARGRLSVVQVGQELRACWVTQAESGLRVEPVT